MSRTVNEVIEMADKAMNTLHSVNKSLVFPKVKPLEDSEESNLKEVTKDLLSLTGDSNYLACRDKTDCFVMFA